MLPLEKTGRFNRVAVIWIDWYPYHVARLRGLLESFPEQVIGIELVGGVGVHAGLKFREGFPVDLSIETLLPTKNWRDANKTWLALTLWRKLSDLAPDVVLIPGYYTLPGIAAALWARTHGAQSVLMTESTAGDHPRVGWKETVKSIVIRTLFNWAVVGGKRHVEYLVDLGFSPDRVAPFYDVVDNDFFSFGARALRRVDTPVRSSDLPDSSFFLYVGRLAAEKNVSALLSSWFAYRDQGGAWPLVLVGDGPEACKLQASVRESRHFSSVFFPGLRSSRDLLPFYATAGCFVLPSTREPWGLVVNEAMASGLPILISSSCGCADDLLQPARNGFMFSPHDVVSLTDLMHRIASLPEERRREMGTASQEIIMPFSPRNFGNSVRSIVEEARSQPVCELIGGSR